MRLQKGITLVALVITIVVLLILAVVSITSITEGDIINGAQSAANTFQDAVNMEKDSIDEADDLLNHYLIKYY